MTRLSARWEKTAQSGATFARRILEEDLDERWKRGEAGGESDSVAAGCTEVGVQKAAHRCSRASSRRHERDLERFHGTRL